MDIRLAILLGLVGLAVSEPASGEGACALCLHDLCYVKTKLQDSYSIPNILNYAVDRNDNTLYYTDLYNSVWSINLQEKVMKRLRYNRIERSLAVDQNTRDLYIAADTDIIKYNPVTNKTETIPIGVEVTKLGFKNKLYVLSHRHKLFALEGSSLVKIPPINDNFVGNFAVDRTGAIYFSRYFNENFKLPAAGGKVSKAFSDRHFVYATDNNEDIYFIDVDDKSILKLDYSTDQFVLVGAFDPEAFNKVMMDALFDRDNNVIFVEYDNVNTKEQELYYLTPNSQHCRVVPKIEAA